MSVFCFSTPWVYNYNKPKKNRALASSAWFYSWVTGIGSPGLHPCSKDTVETLAGEDWVRASSELLHVGRCCIIGTLFKISSCSWLIWSISLGDRILMDRTQLTNSLHKAKHWWDRCSSIQQEEWNPSTHTKLQIGSVFCGLLPWIIANKEGVIFVIHKHKLPAWSLRVIQQTVQIKQPSQLSSKLRIVLKLLYVYWSPYTSKLVDLGSTKITSFSICHSQTNSSR
jgi:hypothetical protein